MWHIEGKLKNYHIYLFMMYARIYEHIWHKRYIYLVIVEACIININKTICAVVSIMHNKAQSFLLDFLWSSHLV